MYALTEIKKKENESGNANSYTVARAKGGLKSESTKGHLIAGDEAAEGPSNASDDFCREYINSLERNRPIQRTPNVTPCILEDEWKQSLAHKYMNYEMEPNYIDLENPWLDGLMIEDLRKNEPRRKNKKKDKSNEEYSAI